MKINGRQVNDISFLEPLEEYLKICNIEIDHFIYHLKVMDISYLRCYLNPLFHYGLVSILLPLNDIVPFILNDDDQRMLWKKMIKESKW